MGGRPVPTLVVAESLQAKFPRTTRSTRGVPNAPDRPAGCLAARPILSAASQVADWRKRVTPFQRRVYEVILGIPKGEVRTYGEVARMIGQPNAARAVGQALKRNRWAPQIPCHRVVASDGTLGGYSARGGVRAKRRLLRREGVYLPKI